MLKKSFLLIAILLIGLTLWRESSGLLTLESLKIHLNELTEYVELHPNSSLGWYVLIYICATALSIPGATVLTLAGGAVFGLVRGSIAVSFASTIGATLAFLLTRLLFQDFVQDRFGARLKKVQEGFRREGAFYLFALRLVPIFPFFLVNIASSLTPLSPLKFMIVSQIGMLPGTIAYVNAGTELSKIDSLQGILTPRLLIAFGIIGILPLLCRRFVQIYRSRRVLLRFKRPRKFDYNIVVIGGGAGGLVASYIAALGKAKVVLVERRSMGGECLNFGCVPSKSLIHSANESLIRSGGNGAGGQDFKTALAEVARAIKQVAPHDSIERYTSLGVECIKGDALVVDPWRVQVGSRTLTARAIVLATGSESVIPEIPGIKEAPVLTPETIWGLQVRPERVLILGGGPVGCEIAQALARLGISVTLIEVGAELLPREDSDVGEIAFRKLTGSGVKVHLRSNVVSLKKLGNSWIADVKDSSGSISEVGFDFVFCSAGRKPRFNSLNLENVGVEILDGKLVLNEYLQTTCPTIYACGDVAGHYQFTHTAAHEAWYVAMNALLAPFKRFNVDYSVIPRCTFLDPEVARVGINEKEALADGIKFEKTLYDISELDRAIVDRAREGFVKVLTKPGSDRILGAVIVAPRAGELIAEVALAMRSGLGLKSILRTVHLYPSYSEGLKYAAGAWQKERISPSLLKLSDWFFRWRLK